MWPKTACLSSYRLKSHVSVTYCLLVEFNHQKMHLLHQTIRSGKEIQKDFINGMRESEGSEILHYGKPRLV